MNFSRWFITIFLVVGSTIGSAQVAVSSKVITDRIEAGDSTALGDWIGLRCVGSYHADSKQVVLTREEQHLVVVVTSVGCNQFAVILFRGLAGPNTGWLYDQTIHLPSRDGMAAQISYPEFVDRGIHEIMASNVATDSGSGVAQTDRIILKLVGERLLTVLDEPEFVKFVSKGVDISQKSNFSVHDSAAANISGNAFLKEERVVSTGGNRVVRTRNCFWNPDLQHFSCVEGVPSQRP